MKDMEMMLESRRTEISDFLSHANREREELLARLDSLDKQIRDAEADGRRVTKALGALSSDEMQTAAMDRNDQAVPISMPLPSSYQPGMQ